MASLINLPIRDNEFVIVSYNLRSLLPKIDSLQIMVNESKPDILNINETWLKDTIPDQLVALEGYDLLRYDRKSNHRGGGVASYIKQGNGAVYDEHSLMHLNQSNNNIEIQVFTIKIRNIKKMLIINSYRPPKGNIDTFLDGKNDTLQAIPKLHEFEVFITGDWNIAYNQENSAGHKKVDELCTRFGFSQVIQEPTRCTLDTSNILDLIITNCTHVRAAGTTEVNLSDHQPTYLIRKKKKAKIETTKFTCRSFKNYIRDDFQSSLLNVDWSSLFQSTDPNTAWELLYTEILKCADKHCPFQTFTRLSKLPPWLLPELL